MFTISAACNALPRVPRTASTMLVDAFGSTQFALAQLDTRSLSKTSREYSLHLFGPGLHALVVGVTGAPEALGPRLIVDAGTWTHLRIEGGTIEESRCRGGVPKIRSLSESLAGARVELSLAAEQRVETFAVGVTPTRTHLGGQWHGTDRRVLLGARADVTSLLLSRR